MSKYNGVEIAVIGMAGQFPGANDVNEFWNNLKSGVESISSFSDEELIAAGENRSVVEDPLYVRANAFLEGKEYFDASFFGYRPDEAMLMAPSIRLFHQYCWNALEDAGYDVTDYDDKIGLFAGGSPDNNWENYAMLSNQHKLVDEYSASQLRNITFLCSRISYLLNLQGPSIFVNTACSTSLVAIQRACMSLLLRECKMALAGGITINNYSRRGYLYQEGMINSRDGHCRVFDADASGTVSGEGGAVVVLKRLADAIADGDHIYAVIKGSGINNDGNDKMSFTAPGVKGQYNAVLKAVNMAGVNPDSISFIETHGTGTHLGDPVEIEALRRVFGDSSTPYCALGAVKTNIGHLDAAAGIAGFIKTVLSLQHRQLVPTLHFRQPNGAIDFKDSPFYVNTKLQDWSHGEHPLRAGVSSFGIGGTNAHVVLEEAPMPALSSPGRKWQLLLLSAKTPAALERNTANLRSYLTAAKEVSVADVAYTLQQGRMAMGYRRFDVCRVDEENRAMLFSEGKTVYRGDKGKPSVVFMFSGQGAQYVNMYRGLYEEEPLFRAEVDNCFELVRSINGLDLQSIVFNSEGDQTSETRYAQPLLFIMEYSLSRLLMAWGITPDVLIGHSIGEYTGACLGGVMSLESCLRLVLKRGELMQAAPAGVMMSVGISESLLLPFLSAHSAVSLAAVNSTGLCVVSGPLAAVQALEQVLTREGYKTTLLRTSHAFHSHMMDEVPSLFESFVQEVKMGRPQIPQISTLTGAAATAGTLSTADYWCSQLRNPVRFSDGIAELLTNRETVFIEVGPGNALSTFVRTHDQRNREHHHVVSLVGHARNNKEDQHYLFQGLGELWQLGLEPDWRSFYKEETRHRVSLPTYSFDRQSYPVDVDAAELLMALLPASSARRQAVKDWLYTPSWKLLPALSEKEHRKQTTLLFCDNDGLQHYYEERGDEVIVIHAGSSFRELSPFRYEIIAGEERSYEKLFTVLRGHGIVADRIIHGWGLTVTGDLYTSVYYSLLYIIRSNRSLRELVLLTADVYRVLDSGPLCDVASLGSTLLKVLSQEYPTLITSHIDVSLSEEGWQQAVVKEMNESVRGRTICIRHGHSWAQHYDLLTTREEALPAGGIYLITGGLGGFGYTLSTGLLAGHAQGLILTGRIVLPPRSEWEASLLSEEVSAVVKDRISKIQSLEAQGCRVLYASCDISSVSAMEALVQSSESVLGGRITGVVHAAGIVEGRSIGAVSELSPKDFEEQFLPKIRGLEVLSEVFSGHDLEFLIATSSLSVVLGGIGFGAYAPANGYMDSYISSLVNTGKVSRWMSIDFDGLEYGTVEGGGITGRELVELWQRIMSVRHLPRVVISVSDLQIRLQEWVNREPVTEKTGKHIQKVTPETIIIEAAEGNVESSLKELWEQFFGLPNIMPNDDFFEIGGDSLKALTMIGRIQDIYNVAISFNEFLNGPSIKEISAYIDAALQKTAADKRRLHLHNRLKQESTI